MPDRGKEFADIVYTILVVEKRRSAADVAAMLGMSYPAFHARLINRTSFSADEIRRLITAIPDSRIVAYILDGTSFVAADRTFPEKNGLPLELQRSATRVVVTATGVLEAVDDALADHHLDHQESRKIHREILAAERALASLRVRIERKAAAHDERA